MDNKPSFDQEIEAFLATMSPIEKIAAFRSMVASAFTHQKMIMINDYPGTEAPEEYEVRMAYNNDPTVKRLTDLVVLGAEKFFT